MKKIRNRVLLDKVERQIYKLDKRILKMSTLKFELQEVARKLELDIKEAESAVHKI